jgi:hypothetical protein
MHHKRPSAAHSPLIWYSPVSWLRRRPAMLLDDAIDPTVSTLSNPRVESPDKDDGGRLEESSADDEVEVAEVVDDEDDASAGMLSTSRRSGAGAPPRRANGFLRSGMAGLWGWWRWWRWWLVGPLSGCGELRCRRGLGIKYGPVAC